MQDATSAINILHFFSPIFAFNSGANHKSSIQSRTLRFKVHETLQINPWNFLTTNIPLIRERCISYNKKGNLLNSFSILNLVLLLIVSVYVCLSNQ